MKVDVCIIGGGPGGYVAAIKAAQRGLTTVLVEKDTLGGVCLNWGCIPTKTMLKSAKVYVQTLHASTYGVVVDKESVKPDLPTMIRKKNGVVRKLTSGVKYLLEKNHVTVIQGTATAVDESTIQVGDERITATLVSHRDRCKCLPSPDQRDRRGIEKWLCDDRQRVAGPSRDSQALGCCRWWRHRL
jgi:pyruvate/2-oxoglutarate dehydrogenase complex dihydrolipoamide dehydrogenase (E3) component